MLKFPLHTNIHWNKVLGDLMLKNRAKCTGFLFNSLSIVQHFTEVGTLSFLCFSKPTVTSLCSSCLYNDGRINYNCLMRYNQTLN